MGFLQGFFQTPHTGDPITPEEIARQSIIDNVVKTTGLMWILGLSLIGSPLIVALLFLRGFVIGFSVGFLVDQMVYKGVALAAVAIVPHNLVILPSVVVAAGASLSFSLAAIRKLFGNGQENMYYQFLSTTLLCLMAALGLVGAAFIEGYITPTLIELARVYIFYG